MVNGVFIITNERDALSKARLRHGLERPNGHFRAPHYTVNAQGLFHETAVAVCGTLFLDEGAEFNKSTLGAALRLVRYMPPAARPVVWITYRTKHDLERIEEAVATATTSALPGAKPTDAPSVVRIDACEEEDGRC